MSTVASAFSCSTVMLVAHRIPDLVIVSLEKEYLDAGFSDHGMLPAVYDNGVVTTPSLCYENLL